MPSKYERDFFKWTQEQVGHLRAGRFKALDLAHLAEEIESMGVSERREIRNRLRILLQHLLKWEYQPDCRSSGWKATITEQRVGIESVLADSSSLTVFPESILENCYCWAIRQAAAEPVLLKLTSPRPAHIPSNTCSPSNFGPAQASRLYLDRQLTCRMLIPCTRVINPYENRTSFF